MRLQFFSLLFYISGNVYSQELPGKVVTILASESSFADFCSNPVIKEANLFDTEDEAEVTELGLKSYSSYFLQTGRKDSWNVKDTAFYLQLRVLNDTIVYKRLLKITYTEDMRDPHKEKMYYSYDAPSMLKCVQKHNDIYQSSNSLESFLNDESVYGVFGYSCGFIGGITDGALKLAEIVENNDQQKSGELAASFNAQDRAFGTAGLYFLQLKGEKLSEINESRMQLNRNSEVMLQTCHGCVYTSETMKESLSSESLIGMYEFLQTRGIPE